MKIVRVPLKHNPYKIVVGSQILKDLGENLKSLKIGQDAIIITNPIIKRLYGAVVSAGLKKAGFSVKIFEVPDGEKSKSAKVAFDLIEKIALFDIFKRPFIIALGGGVIGDLAGYVAAAYKRGILYVQVPTTLLAQVDSSIGGKVAIDLPIGKNLVGAFYQPKMVFSDVSVLKSLDKRQVLNGFAEVIKYGIIYDKDLFQYILNNIDKLIGLNLKALENVVLACSKIKAEVVVKDEKETKGVRTILNFGHTIGHAIEAAAAYNYYQHGEAVALGMRIVTEISLKLALVSRKSADQINELLTLIGLPVVIRKVKMKDILRLMRHDKKFLTGKNRFVLVKTVGKVKVVEGINLDLIKGAIKKYMA